MNKYRTIKNCLADLRAEIKSSFLSYRQRENFRLTKRLFNSQEGRGVFVFGNGPSAGKIDPKKLQLFLRSHDFDVIACNNYFLSDLSKDVVPNYYVLSDPDWFFPEETNKGKEFIRDIKENNKKLEDSGIPIFLPFEFFEKHDLRNPVYFFNDLRVIYRRYNRNILSSRSFASMTGLKAIRIADYLGYDNIFMMGIDNTLFREFKVDKLNRLVMRHHHFYSGADVTFFKNCSVSDFLIRCASVFDQLNEFNERSKGNIYNLDIESYVDVFEKHSLFDIYQS